jgi:hypothetical protein
VRLKQLAAKAFLSASIAASFGFKEQNLLLCEI